MINSSDYKKFLELQSDLNDIDSQIVMLNKKINNLNNKRSALKVEMDSKYKGYKDIDSDVSDRLKSEIIRDKVFSLAKYAKGGGVKDYWNDFVNEVDLSEYKKANLNRVERAVLDNHSELKAMIDYSNEISLELDDESDELVKRAKDLIMSDIKSTRLNDAHISELKEIIYKFVKYQKEL